MKIPAANPHAIIEIERPYLTDGQRTVDYDSWTAPQLIKNVSVELATNQTSEARITFFDPKFRIIDTFGEVEPRTIIRVYLGYGEKLGQPIFKGILGQIERGETDTTFVVLDMAFVMKRFKRSGYKNRKDDLGIIKDLIERNETPAGKKLKFEGPDKPKKLEPNNAMMADEMTDWEWMSERARDAGLMFYVREDTVFLKYPGKADRDEVLALQYKKDFRILSGWDLNFWTPENLDARPKVVKHQRRGRNGRFIRGSSNEGSSGREITSSKRDMQGASKGKLTARARAQRELDREHAFECHIETIMPPDGERPDVRNTVRLMGMGKLFSGLYTAKKVDYQFEPGTLTMGLDLYRDAEK